MLDQNKNVELLQDLKKAFSAEEWNFILQKKEELVRRYTIDHKRGLSVEDRENVDITEAIQGKNLTVMYGGGKDSGVMLGAARTMQLMIAEEHGVILQLRVGIGEHAGMIGGVYQNINNALDVLKLNNDPDVDIVWINRDKTHTKQNLSSENAGTVGNISRQNILGSGHLFSGAGRRTFCDSCNIGLGQWITTMLNYNGGADIFMTGDNTIETSAQIDGAVNDIAKDLGVELLAQQNMSPTQKRLKNLELVGKKHSQIIHGDEAEVLAFNYPDIPKKAQFMGFFGDEGIGNSIGKRIEFLRDYLKMDYSTLAFSFTESDCGNPALMCHIYGLIAEHAYKNQGVTYGDGIRMFLDYIMPKVEEKKFPPEFVDELKKRYQNDDAITETRAAVEDYAKKAYDLGSQQVIAMVYAPFTQSGVNMKKYLDYLRTIDNPDAAVQTVINSENQISTILKSDLELNPKQAEIVSALNELTGLSLEQMRKLYKRELYINNFDPKHRLEPDAEKILNTLDKDWLYIGKGTLKHAGQEITEITIRAR